MILEFRICKKNSGSKDSIKICDSFLDDKLFKSDFQKNIAI